MRLMNLDVPADWVRHWCTQQTRYCGFQRRYVVTQNTQGQWLFIGGTVLAQRESVPESSELTVLDYGHTRLVEDWPSLATLGDWIEAFNQPATAFPCGAKIDFGSVNWSVDRLYQWDLPNAPAGCRLGTRLGEMRGYESRDFLHATHPYFPDIKEALNYWLAYPYHTSRSDPTHAGELSFLLPETRAYITEFDETTRQLRFGGDLIDQQAWSGLSIKGSWWTQEGMGHFTQPVSDTELTLKLPKKTRRLECLLINDALEILDQRQFNHFDYWNTGAVTDDQTSEDHDPVEALNSALQRGEGTTVEFKSYVDLTDQKSCDQSNEKSKSKLCQVYRTVIAFANTEGGELFIGVTDELEPLGIEAMQSHWNKLRGKDDIPTAMNRYCNTLKKQIRDKVVGEFNLDVRWFQTRGKHFVLIQVGKIDAKAACLHDDNRAFVRRGASNTIAAPHSDWERLVGLPKQNQTPFGFEP